MGNLHEECGVMGIYSPNRRNVAHTVYTGLYALQHRGQESAGIVVNDDGLFYSHKDLGLVSDVFGAEQLAKFPMGTMAVGHVRYGTSGETNRENAQPMIVNHKKGRLAVAHNGNLANAWKLRDKLETEGAIFHSTNDTEIIAHILIRKRLVTPSIEQAALASIEHFDGAYSLILMSPTKMIAVRDPHGFRPLCYGQTEDGAYVIASEDCALASVGAKKIREVEPGELILFSEKGVTSFRNYCNTAPHKICIFEYIYFARTDSEIEGVSVHEARKRAGAILAKQAPVDADLVIGVPDSGLDAALGYAEASGIPYGIGFVKNKYIGRTFISPGQKNRMEKVRIKLNPIREVVKDKKIVMIDDSIVRGTTSQSIIRLIKEAGAKEVHMRITAPPFRHPCYYGTDVDSSDHLIANQHTIPEIAELIGADSLAYLPMESLCELVGHNEYCAACFDGNYPTEVPGEHAKNRFDMPLSAGRE